MNIEDRNTLSSSYSELYHYTSIHALESIIRTRSLWATHARHFSDSSEMQCILHHIKRALRDCIDEEVDSSSSSRLQLLTSFSEALLDGLPSVLNREAITPGLESLYIVSFTAHETEYHQNNGMLSQWRGYGGRDCAAIVFNTLGLERLMKREQEAFCFSRSLLVPVKYDDSRTLSDLFPELNDAVRRSVQILAGNSSGEIPEYLEFLHKELMPRLISSAAQLKHRGFDEENECRMVVGVAPPRRRGLLVPADTFEGGRIKRVHHRVGPHGSIPYVRLFNELDEELPIGRILLGPSLNQRANLERVREIIEDRGIDLRMSDIPFAGSTRIDVGDPPTV